MAPPLPVTTTQDQEQIFHEQIYNQNNDGYLKQGDDSDDSDSVDLWSMEGIDDWNNQTHLIHIVIVIPQDTLYIYRLLRYLIS